MGANKKHAQHAPALRSVFDIFCGGFRFTFNHLGEGSHCALCNRLNFFNFLTPDLTPDKASQQQLGQVVVGVEARHVDVDVDAGHDAVLGELPDGVVAVPADGGLGTGVAADVEGVSVELRREVLVVEVHGGIDHGPALVVALEHAGQQCQAVDELAARPCAAVLDVDHGDEVLRHRAHGPDKVGILLAHGRCGGQVVIAAHEQPVPLCLPDVALIVWRAIGGSLGGLDVGKAQVVVGGDLGPVDVALVAGDIDAVNERAIAAGRYVALVAPVGVAGACRQCRHHTQHQQQPHLSCPFHDHRFHQGANLRHISGLGKRMDGVVGIFDARRRRDMLP